LKKETLQIRWLSPNVPSHQKSTENISGTTARDREAILHLTWQDSFVTGATLLKNLGIVTPLRKRIEQ
jgi:hypothetical protein